MKDICLWFHIALNIEVNICIPSFSLPPLHMDSFCQSTWISQHYQDTQMILMRLKPKKCLKKHNDMYSQLQIC